MGAHLSHSEALPDAQANAERRPWIGRGAILFALFWLASVAAILSVFDRRDPREGTIPLLSPDGIHPIASTGAANRRAGGAAVGPDVWQTALARVEPLLDDDPANLALLRSRARILVQLGAWDRAQQDYTTLTHQIRRDVGIWLEVADLHENLARWKAVVDDYDRMIEINPRLACAHARRGFALASLGHWDDAEMGFARSIFLAPGGPDAWRYRAYSRLRAGDFSAYRRACWSLLAYALEHPSEHSAHLNLWTCSLIDGAVDMESLVTAAQASLRAAPGDPFRRGSLGAALLRSGDMPHSIKLLDQAARRFEHDAKLQGMPQPAYYRFLLSQAYARQGQSDRAKRCYQRGVDWMEQSSHVAAVAGGRAGRLFWDQELTLAVLRQQAQNAIH